jgi:uncharacterized protein YeaO (DUF488 family)
MSDLDIEFSEFNERMQKELKQVIHNYLFSNMAVIAKRHNITPQVAAELYSEWEDAQATK